MDCGGRYGPGVLVESFGETRSTQKRGSSRSFGMTGIRRIWNHGVTRIRKSPVRNGPVMRVSTGPQLSFGRSVLQSDARSVRHVSCKPFAWHADTSCVDSGTSKRLEGTSFVGFRSRSKSDGAIMGKNSVVGASGIVVGANNVKEGKPVARGAYSVIVAGLALSLMLGNAPAGPRSKTPGSKFSHRYRVRTKINRKVRIKINRKVRIKINRKVRIKASNRRRIRPRKTSSRPPDEDQPPADQQRPPADQSQAADRAQAPQDAPAPPPKPKSKPKYVQQDANRPPYVNDREQSGNSPYSAPPPSAQDDRAAQDDRDDQGQRDMRQPDDRDDQQPPDQADRQ